MGRSGKLISLNDDVIDSLLVDPNYIITPDGIIKTCIAETGKKFIDKSRWRIGGYDNKGYRTLRYKKRRILIHRIIWAKFGNLPLASDLTINHINGLRSDNRIENLEHVPQSLNNLHRFRVLKHPASYGSAKITLEIANQIRADHKNGLSYRKILKKYSILKSISNISAIINMKTWT